MSDPHTSNPSTKSETNPSVPKDEQMSEQDRSVGGSDGAALLGARVDESIAAPASESPEGVDNEPKAGSSHPQQTSTSNRDGPPPPPPSQLRKRLYLASHSLQAHVPISSPTTTTITRHVSLPIRYIKRPRKMLAFFACTRRRLLNTTPS
ncbi:hypothetical protein CPB85DRAFT_296113 [Mucidula mucida]|nr:hypothetical protein CPB85DRAFT_296113 [Mucidula mucida]